MPEQAANPVFSDPDDRPIIS